MLVVLNWHLNYNLLLALMLSLFGLLVGLLARCSNNKVHQSDDPSRIVRVRMHLLNYFGEIVPQRQDEFRREKFCRKIQ